MTLQEILESVKSGSVSVEEAERILKKESYEEMGYAKLDTSRKARTGFAEVIYCSNKADEHLLNIFERLYREDGEVFGTRASQHQYELVKEKFPEVEYDPISRILKVEKKDKAKPFATIFGGIGTLVDKTQDKLSGLFTDTSDKIE